MKDKLVDLHRILFGQLEKLADSDVTGDVLAEEILRADAMVATAGTILNGANLAYNVAKTVASFNKGGFEPPALLQVESGGAASAKKA